MSRRILSTALLAGLLVLPACGDDSGTNAPDDDPLAPFVGTWTGVSMVFTPVGGGQGIDLILAGGTLTVTIMADGRYTQSFELTGLTSVTESGNLSIQGNQVTLAADGDPNPVVGTFVFSQNNTRLTVNASDGVEFDFNLDQVDDPATLVMVLQKN